MSDLTMTARVKLAEPPRLFQIEEAIRRVLATELCNCVWPGDGSNVNGEDIDTISHLVMNELTDQHLIGLPSGNAARTSVDASLVAQLGEKLACRKGDDADDVLKTAIRVGVIVG